MYMSIINEALKKAQQENKELDVAKPAPAKPDTDLNSLKSAAPALSMSRNRTLRKKSDIKEIVVIALILGGATAVFFIKGFWKGPKATTVPAVTATVPAQGTAAPETPAAAVTPAVSAKNDLSTPSSRPELKLSGIVYDSERPYAIVNDRVLSKGDSIAGATLVEINRDSVRFSFGGEEFELSSR
jgi:hypothetical protein